jgi:predicted metalloprotease with PDZ domain
LVKNFRSLALLATLASALGAAPAARPITVELDLRDAPRKFLHARMTIPVEPGPLTLEFPAWIPGEHGPTGPVDNLAGISFRANGRTIPWRRDDVNMFALHLNVPAGVESLEAHTDFLATAAPTGFSAGASTGPNLAIVSWNEVVLYPAGHPSADIRFEPSLVLPPDWKYGTALETAAATGEKVQFKPVALDMLVDSPVLTGRFFKEVPLAPEVSPKHYLDLAADAPEDLQISASDIDNFSNLVRETGALFRSRHYTSYHFLLTLSDSVAHFGLEHHQSSDDRVGARMFLDEEEALLEGDLLPHEFTHSWNGKFRRPAGLATTSYAQPMKGELLWIYEGLTQYLGDVLAVRSGIWTAEQYRSYLAASAAELDHRPGRTWRNLEDTAVAAQILYSTTSQWDNWRRSVDYYAEGELIWLEVDTKLRQLSKGKRSLNDFCARFLGVRGNTGPEVVPYTLDDVVAELNSLAPYDWKRLLEERVSSLAPHAPLGGIQAGGYRIEYTADSNEFLRASASGDRGVNTWYSLGLKIADNTIEDVLVGSPAYEAGLGPDMRLIAVNGRRATDELLRSAIRDSKTSKEPIELIVENSGFVRVIKIDYHGGEQYPHLVRDGESPALMDDLLKPMAEHQKQARSDSSGGEVGGGR